MSTVIPQIVIEEVNPSDCTKKDPVLDNNSDFEEATKKKNKGKSGPVIENGNLLSPNYLSESAGSFTKMQNCYVDLAAQDGLNETLPTTFTVKYIGRCPTSGLWGIQCTRKSVQKLVDLKRLFFSGPLAVQNFEVSRSGITITAAKQNRNPGYLEFCIPIHLVSYGVQDSVYKRIFAMIVTRDRVGGNGGPMFELFCFVCDNTETVHNLTRALAMAFKIFSDTVEVQEMANRKANQKQSNDLNGYLNGGLSLNEF